MKKILGFSIFILLLIGCNSSNKSSNNINMADYLPAKNTIKKFFTTEDNGTTNFYEEKIKVKNNTISIKRDNKLVKILTINDTNIIEKDTKTKLEKVLKKYIGKGDILFTLPKTIQKEDIKFEDTVLGTKSIESTKTCILERQLDELEDYDIKYYDDILKFKCIEDKKIITKVVDNLPDYINLTNGEEISDHDIS